MTEERFRWALSEDLEKYTEEFLEDILRAQELENKGYSCDISEEDNWPRVFIPRFKDLSFTAEDIQRLFGEPKFGNRAQIALLEGYEYVILTEFYYGGFPPEYSTICLVH
ncbi:MAG: hypothetical protein WC494_02355 [Candidatus Pacearchaeota archaeon]